MYIFCSLLKKHTIRFCLLYIRTRMFFSSNSHFSSSNANSLLLFFSVAIWSCKKKKLQIMNMNKPFQKAMLFKSYKTQNEWIKNYFADVLNHYAAFQCCDRYIVRVNTLGAKN